MIASSIGFVVLNGWLAANALFCQPLDAEVPTEDADLHAFVELGNFCDRGIAAILFVQQRIDSDGNEQKQPEAAIPRDVLQLMEVRKENLAAAESPELPYPLGAVKRWPFDSENPTPKATIDRFRKRGLVELFLSENTKLLDSPLTKRKELMNQVKAISDQIDTLLGSIMFGHVPTESELIFFSGRVRRFSVELDNAILKSLTKAERARISKLAAYLLPSAIAEAKEYNRKYALGSFIYDKNRPAAGRSSDEKK